MERERTRMVPRSLALVTGRMEGLEGLGGWMMISFCATGQQI